MNPLRETAHRRQAHNELPAQKAILRRLLSRYDRVGICGAVSSGKTTLSLSGNDGRLCVHLDDYMGMRWHDQPRKIVEILEDYPRYLVEGMQLARSIRCGLPVQAVLWLRAPLEQIDTRQLGMSKGVRTVMAECADLLEELCEYPPRGSESEAQFGILQLINEP